MGMLVLTRKPAETINVTLPDGETLQITMIETRGHQVRLGFTGRREIFSIVRGELDGEEQPRETQRAIGEDRTEHGEDEAFPTNIQPDA